MIFCEYLTPEEAFKLDPDTPLEEWQRRARNRKKCEVCGQPVWRFADTDLCFTCTTGEADASEDYELVEV